MDAVSRADNRQPFHKIEGQLLTQQEWNDEKELENYTIECPKCEGMGEYDIGDCENGVMKLCFDCDGTGLIDD